MGSGSKGSTSTKQTSDPPKWAKPLLERGAADAMKLYEQGSGYNVYRGPTQAQFSDPRLEGLNRAMMMSGSTGPKITNESIFNNPAIQQARALINKQQEEEAARKVAAAIAGASGNRNAGQGGVMGKLIRTRGPDGTWSYTPYVSGSTRTRM